MLRIYLTLNVLKNYRVDMKKEATETAETVGGSLTNWTLKLKFASPPVPYLSERDAVFDSVGEE